MKCSPVFVFFLTFYAVSSLKLDFSHSENPHKDCAQHGSHHHGADHHPGHFAQDKIEHLNKGEPVDANCPEYTQHLLCIWKEKGMMNEEGALQKDVISTKFAEITGGNSADKEVVEKCVEQKATPGETAIKFYNCIAAIVKKYNS